MDNIMLGRLAEAAAARFYTEKGYKIEKTNLRYGRIGELDIVASKIEDNQSNVVFCEVKCRKNADFAPISSAVNKKKQNRIRTLAGIYINDNFKFDNAEIRFDVAEVLYNGKDFKINILENAF